MVASCGGNSKNYCNLSIHIIYSQGFEVNELINKFQNFQP